MPCRDVAYHLDEPLADMATIPTFMMARETKPHVTVVLSGEGADEALAGYPKYKAFLWLARLRAFAPSGVCRAIGRRQSRIELARGFAALGAEDKVSAYLEMTSVFTAAEMRECLTGSFQGYADLGHARARHIVQGCFDPGLDLLSQQLNLDFHTWLPDDLLLKNDKMTMAHGVEARVPFLDHELLELLARMPSRFKLHGLQDKYLLRKVIAGRVPKQIARRRKTGFTVPLKDWAEGPLRGPLADLFSRESVVQAGLNPSYMEELARKPLDNAYYRRQFWTLVTLLLWARRFQVDLH